MMHASANVTGNDRMTVSLAKQQILAGIPTRKEFCPATTAQFAKRGLQQQQQDLLKLEAHLLEGNLANRRVARIAKGADDLST
jgi:hypothetical protein